MNVYWNFIFVLICGAQLVKCNILKHTQNERSRKLFLSNQVVTDFGIIDGGVLVNHNGVIEAVLSKENVAHFLSSNLLDIEVINGDNLVLMPGVIDTHVHVNEPGRTSWEGYVTATKAAAWGGITTIIDMPLNSIPPTTSLENLKIKASIAREEVYVDVGFWGGVVPGNELELGSMIKAGVVGFKCFLSDSGVSEFPMIGLEDLEKAFYFLNNTKSVLAFHAEMSLGNTNSDCNYTSSHLDSSCPDPAQYSTYLASRPPQMEIEGAKVIASFLPFYNVHVHVVHVSAADVVPILEEARQNRIQNGYKGWRGGVTAETCNHYLTLAAEEVPYGATQFKCAPPVRENDNKQRLWEYIRDHRLDLIASDHSPSVAELKNSNFMTSWGGIASVQFDLSLFWTQASARGYTLSDVSHYLSTGPALLAGLQEKKGTIRPGLDADLIFFDPNASFIVTPEIIRYKNKISPYMNKVLRGRVIQTYVRGQLVYANDEIIGEPKGKLLLNENQIPT